MRFGSWPIFCQASRDGKAMHKNSQAPQWILLSCRLEFTAAYRHLHLHVLQASPTQSVPNQINYLPTHSFSSSLLSGSVLLPIYRTQNLEISVLLPFVPHSPRSICCQFLWIHPVVICFTHSAFWLLLFWWGSLLLSRSTEEVTHLVSHQGGWHHIAPESSIYLDG